MFRAASYLVRNTRRAALFILFAPEGADLVSEDTEHKDDDGRNQHDHGASRDMGGRL